MPTPDERFVTRERSPRPRPAYHRTSLSTQPSTVPSCADTRAVPLVSINPTAASGSTGEVDGQPIGERSGLSLHSGCRKSLLARCVGLALDQLAILEGPHDSNGLGYRYSTTRSTP